jgi:nitrite reductase/ring-hydroxylating ferredoxin subunit
MYPILVEWVPVGPAVIGEKPGEMSAFELAGGRVIAVARLEDGSLAAFDDTCTHEECPMSEGDIEGPWVVCMCHNAAFEVATGAVVRGPAEEPLRTYAVRVVDGDLQVQI